jgi:hypothetical protein
LILIFGRSAAAATGIIAIYAATGIATRFGATRGTAATLFGLGDNVGWFLPSFVLAAAKEAIHVCLFVCCFE